MRSRLAELAIGRAHPALRTVVQGAGARYNADAEHLAELEQATDGPTVIQVAVPASSRLVGRLSTDPGRIAQSLRVGATAMASALYGETTQLMWRPTPLVHHGEWAAAGARPAA
jgi:hypothetical protein